VVFTRDVLEMLEEVGEGRRGWSKEREKAADKRDQHWDLHTPRMPLTSCIRAALGGRTGWGSI
jgi:hypothetical protein